MPDLEACMRPAEDHSGVNVSLQQLLLPRARKVRHYLRQRIPAHLTSVILIEDVVQDVWLDAFRGFADFEGQKEETLDHWLRTIANRALIRAVKKARELPRPSDRL